MNIPGRLDLIVTGIALILLAACSNSGGDKNSAGPPLPGDKLVSTPPAVLALQNETSCDAFKSYVSDSIADLACIAHRFYS